MECKDAEYVLAIAKYQSITIAAKALYISQPALTSYLKNLEGRLSTQLFTRNGKKILPTIAGERYISYAIEVNDCKRKCMQELNRIKLNGHTHLSIAFSTNGTRHVLNEAIANLRDCSPGLQVSIDECTSDIIERKLLAREIDIGFISLPTTSPELGFETLLEEYVLLAVPLTNPLSALGQSMRGCPYPWVDIRRFKDEPFILQNVGSRLRRHSDHIFKQHNIDPYVVMTASSRTTALEFAQHGMGLCLTTDSFVKYTPNCKTMRFFAISNPLEKITAGVAYLRSEDLPLQAWELIDFFKRITIINNDD